MESENYRPISLLSIFNKIFEKSLYTRIYSYFTKNKLFAKKQFGFRKNYSTDHALISITETIKSLIKKGQFVCGVFLDLEKAFDTISHPTLCEKLNYYGLRGKVNHLIKSYLSNRSQFVSINGLYSDKKFITHGVPQGSTLGPLYYPS